MENFFPIFWPIIMLVVLVLSIYYGVKNKKNIYIIVGWVCFVTLFVPIIVAVIQFMTMDDGLERKYDNAKVGTVMEVKGRLDFKGFETEDNKMIYYIFPFDSLNKDNSIFSCDSTHFNIIILSRKPELSVGTIMYVSANVKESRKLKNLTYQDLVKNSQQIELVFKGKKIDEGMWECLEILQINRVKGNPKLILTD